MLAKQLRENIVRVSKEKHMSYTQLEKDAGLHKNYISNLLIMDEKLPKIDAVVKIADTLKVDLDELVGRKQELELNFELMGSCIEAVENLLKKKNRKPSVSRFFFFVREVYAFCLGKKLKTVDKEFAEWFIDHSL